MRNLIEKINAYIYVYGEGYGIAMILCLYFWDALKRILWGFYEPVWYAPALIVNGIGVALIIWSKHLKKD